MLKRLLLVICIGCGVVFIPYLIGYFLEPVLFGERLTTPVHGYWALGLSLLLSTFGIMVILLKLIDYIKYGK